MEPTEDRTGDKENRSVGAGRSGRSGPLPGLPWSAKTPSGRVMDHAEAVSP